MIYINDGQELDIEKSVVVIGKFDGIHRGHMELINRLKEYESKGYTGVLFTFSSGLKTLTSKTNNKTILTAAEKIDYIEKLGIDYMYEYPVDESFIKMAPQSFVDDILKKHLHATIVIVGSDFRFGAKRSGDTSFLKEYGNQVGIDVISLNKLKEDGITISSSNIRDYITNGKIDLANDFLGRPISYSGKVIEGNKLGRRISIPTANMNIDDDKIMPRYGVYVVNVYIKNEKYQGIANIGVKPTVGSLVPLIETYIFDFDNDIYNETITVELLNFIRPEMKFDDIDQLKRQMQLDIYVSKQLISNRA